MDLVTDGGFVEVTNQFPIVFLDILQLAGVVEIQLDSGLAGDDGDDFRPADLKVRHLGRESRRGFVVGEEVGREGHVHRGDRLTD